MTSTEPSPGTVSYGGLGFARSGGSAVVWLRGEQDISTVAALTGTLARAIAIDDADLVVDLSEVRFMGAAPVEVLVRAREFLRVHARSLTLRSPSAWLSRVLERGGLGDLVDPHPPEATHAAGPAGALGTWVAVPATERADRAANNPEPELGGTHPSGHGRVTAPTEPSTDSQQSATERRSSVAGGGGP